ncbi:glycosyltransferase [Halalkalibacter wakoensis JCM 9140]|uniref:Glycosyltransferase n=2 Tax=Halalkalibacter wakoensis TaxID=127891 RepID=W4Q816_9BACI|nr:glycosyltransferase [Halalkalibacter wakoensis JCM 9140]
MLWFHRSFQRVYVPSQSTKDKLVDLKFHPDLEIWGRGIDHSYFHPERRTNSVRETYRIKQKNILLYVGRIAPEKEIDLALRTFHSLPSSIKDETHFLLVGDGPQLKMLSQYSNEQVTFTGFKEGDELADIYASSDLFLFPSSTETFGNVVLEAMASGLPVIGANAGGVQHLIQHGETGFLCEPKDQESFTRLTGRLLQSGYKRSAFSVRAREYALSYSWEEIFSDLVNSYNEIMIRNQKRHSA